MALKHKVTRVEKTSYGLYFLGQNIFYMLIFLYMNTYFTDVGITAAAVAAIALAVKVWDAINDPIFGGLMDKVRFSKGKFIPWLKISLVGIPVATILLFAIPTQLSLGWKIAWAVIAYMLWDTAYTLCDVPIFGLVTTLTDVQEERTSLNAIGRVCAMIAAMAVTVVIPLFRELIGGWTATVILLSAVGLGTMIPITVTGRERFADTAEERDGDVGLKDMLRYLKVNKYLLLFYAAYMARGTFNVLNIWGLYLARHCLKNESWMTLTAFLLSFPTVLVGPLIPRLTKRVDKFKIFYGAAIATIVMNLVRLVVGYDNLPLFFVVMFLQGIPMGFTQVLSFMFTPDCAEYGHYKTRKALPGITFATQTFFVKLEAALVTVVGSLALVAIGFIEGEGAAQLTGFDHKLWIASCILPIIGLAIQLVLLSFYKLNDHDVQLMARYNTGEISREEAERRMLRRY